MAKDSIWSMGLTVWLCMHLLSIGVWDTDFIHGFYQLMDQLILIYSHKHIVYQKCSDMRSCPCTDTGLRPSTCVKGSPHFYRLVTPALCWVLGHWQAPRAPRSFRPWTIVELKQGPCASIAYSFLGITERWQVGIARHLRINPIWWFWNLFSRGASLSSKGIWPMTPACKASRGTVAPVWMLWDPGPCLWLPFPGALRSCHRDTGFQETPPPAHGDSGAKVESESASAAQQCVAGQALNQDPLAQKPPLFPPVSKI